MKNHGPKKLEMYIMINLEIQIQNSEMFKIQKPIGKQAGEAVQATKETVFFPTVLYNHSFSFDFV